MCVNYSIIQLFFVVWRILFTCPDMCEYMVIVVWLVLWLFVTPYIIEWEETHTSATQIHQTQKE